MQLICWTSEADRATFRRRQRFDRTRQPKPIQWSTRCPLCPIFINSCTAVLAVPRRQRCRQIESAKWAPRRPVSNRNQVSKQCGKSVFDLSRASFILKSAQLSVHCARRSRCQTSRHRLCRHRYGTLHQPTRLVRITPTPATLAPCNASDSHRSSRSIGIHCATRAYRICKYTIC